MSALIAKREELSKKMNDLLAERTADINVKVEAYRASLEATTPVSNEIQEIQAVIAALDKVIDFEKSFMTPVVKAPVAVKVEEPVLRIPVEDVAIVEPKIVEPVLEVKDTETIATYTTIPSDIIMESRPGMADITTPERG